MSWPTGARSSAIREGTTDPNSAKTMWKAPGKINIFPFENSGVRVIDVFPKLIGRGSIVAMMMLKAPGKLNIIG